MLSGWSSRQAPPIPLGSMWSGTMSLQSVKFMVADCAFPVLLDDLSVQQLSHLGWRPEFAISPGVVRIFDALNTKLKSAFFPRLLATAAEE